MGKWFWLFVALVILGLLVLLYALAESAHQQSEAEQREELRRYHEDAARRLKEAEERERIKALLKGEE